AAAAAVWYGVRLLPNWYLHILPLTVRKFWPKKLTMTSFLHPTSAMAMPSKPTMAPTRNGAFSTSTSSVALRLATSGLNSESRTTVSTFRPITPPSALTSSTAICVAASISWASRAIGPVCGTTTPSLIGCSPRARRFTNGKPETAAAAPAPARPFNMVRRVVPLMAVPPRSRRDGVADAESISRRARPVHRARGNPRRHLVGSTAGDSARDLRLALRAHPGPHHPRPRGDLVRGDAPGGRARRGPRLRLGVAVRPLPDPGARGLRGGRGDRPSRRRRAGRRAAGGAAARVLDRAVGPRPGHRPPAARHQRALPLVSLAVRPRQDGGHARRDQRGAARPRPGRRLVRAGVPRLRPAVSEDRRAHRPARRGGGDHPPHVDRAAPGVPRPPLRHRRRGVRHADAPVAAPAHLDRRRGRPRPSPRRAGRRRRERAVVGTRAHRRPPRLPRRG